MASQKPAGDSSEAAAILNLRKHIQDLESQLDIAYDELSKLNGGEEGRPTKRVRRDDNTADTTTDINNTATTVTANTNTTTPTNTTTTNGAKEEPPPTSIKPTDARIIRHQLQQHIDNLTEQIKHDYLEGYEEQWETKLEWYESLRDPLQQVLDIGVGKQTALKECNDVLKMVADSWDALMACGCRMDTREELSESEASFELVLPWAGGGGTAGGGGEEEEDNLTQTIIAGEHVENAWGWVWVALLRTHATLNRKQDEQTLLQCIRDLDGYMPKDEGCITIEGPLADFLDLGEASLDDQEGVPDGGALKKLAEERMGEWKMLPCDKRTRTPLVRKDFGFDNDDDSEEEDEDEDGSDEDGDDGNVAMSSEVPRKLDTDDEDEDGDDDDDDDDDDDGGSDDVIDVDVDSDDNDNAGLNETIDTYESDGDDGGVDETMETYESDGDDGDDDGLNETYDSEGEIIVDDEDEDGDVGAAGIDAEGDY